MQLRTLQRLLPQAPERALYFKAWIPQMNLCTPLRSLLVCTGLAAPRGYTHRCLRRAPSYSSPSTSSPAYGSSSDLSGSSLSPTPSTQASPQPARSSCEDLPLVIMRVQMALVVKKYYTGTIDGIMGNGTRSALMTFQMDSGLPVSGKIRKRLMRTSAVGQKRRWGWAESDPLADPSPTGGAGAFSTDGSPAKAPDVTPPPP